jgi:hypothetical protein
VNREAIPVLIVAVVCATALVFAAATLADTTQQSGTGVGTGGGSGGEGGSGRPIDGDPRNVTRDPQPLDSSQQPSEFCSKGPDVSPLAAIPLVGVLAFGAFVYRRAGPQIAVISVVILLVPLAAGYFFVYGSDCPEDNRVRSQPTLNETNRSSEEPTRNETGGGGGPNQFSLPVPVLAVVAVGLVAVILATALGRKRMGSIAPAVLVGDDDPDDLAAEDADTDALGRAAGRAADRIETGTDAENEVYRAWVEMTRHLDVDHPESSTPAEFAAAAVDAGLDPDDVDELTRQFEAVRYGGDEPTTERERRAIEALRRIEAEYADDGE